MRILEWLNEKCDDFFGALFITYFPLTVTVFLVIVFVIMVIGIGLRQFSK